MPAHPPNPVRIALIGDSMIAQRVLGRLLESGFEITACLPGGDAFAAEARASGVRTEAVGADLATLCREPCDWILSVFNTRILPAEVIDHPARGVINFHDGPLPRYAGLYAPTRALLDGADEHGVAWHLVDEGIDTGDLLVTEPVSIEAGDTALTLQLRCVEAGCRSFERLIPVLHEADPQGRVQDPSLRTFFGSG
ncbi:MAG: peptide synthetase, partial [Planctomycetaceae bacterium]|nr:peptide synthetase [Planctomycetaceae bacterium]